MTVRALLVGVLLAVLPPTAPASEEPPTLPSGVHALHRPDGVTCDPNQFAALESTIGDASVVALGEASHGSRTMFQAKACTVRFLIEELGFGLIAFEGNVNLLAYEKDLEQAFARSTSIYAVESILALFEWVRAREGDDVRIVLDGFDTRTSPRAIDRLLHLLDDIDPAFAESIRPTLEGIGTFDAARWEEGAERWLHQARDLLAHLQASEEAYSETASERRLEGTIEDARRIVQHLENFVSGPRRRDQYMAQNVLRILDRYPNERLILWAHNDHVRESRFLRSAQSPSMGTHLSEALAEDYVSVAFTFGTGAYTATRTIASREHPAPELATNETEPPMQGTIEANLRDLGWPDVLILFDALDAATRESLGLHDSPQAMRSIGHHASRNAFDFYDLTSAFDALAYVDRSRASTPITSPK